MATTPPVARSPAINTTSRLEHQCRGGEVTMSEAADTESREASAGRMLTEDSATLRGIERAGASCAGWREQDPQERLLI